MQLDKFFTALIFIVTLLLTKVPFSGVGETNVIEPIGIVSILKLAKEVSFLFPEVSFT